MALRKMGSSVFHGGFSTFIAIVVLAPSNTYVFIVFFRLWFGIILFGMMNGFILLPVILTFVGPIYTITEEDNSTPNIELTPTERKLEENPVDKVGQDFETKAEPQLQP